MNRNSQFRMTKPRIARLCRLQHSSNPVVIWNSLFLIRQLMRISFMVPARCRKAEEALDEPQSAIGILAAAPPEKSTAGKMPAAPWRCRLIRFRFMVPMPAQKRKGTFLNCNVTRPTGKGAARRRPRRAHSPDRYEPFDRKQNRPRRARHAPGGPQGPICDEDAGAILREPARRGFCRLRKGGHHVSDGDCRGAARWASTA